MTTPLVQFLQVAVLDLQRPEGAYSISLFNVREGSVIHKQLISTIVDGILVIDQLSIGVVAEAAKLFAYMAPDLADSSLAKYLQCKCETIIYHQCQTWSGYQFLDSIVPGFSLAWCGRLTFLALQLQPPSLLLLQPRPGSPDYG